MKIGKFGISSIYPTMPDIQPERFHKVRSKNGTYYYGAGIPNQGDYVYVDTHDPNSEGMAGRDCTFKLIDGGTDTVHGPWMTSSRSLKADTGIDLTHLHWTRMAIYEVTEEWSHRNHGEPFFLETGPILGDFYRTTPIMKQWLKDYPDKRWYFAVTSTGGARGMWDKHIKDEPHGQLAV